MALRFLTTTKYMSIHSYLNDFTRISYHLLIKCCLQEKMDPKCCLVHQMVELVLYRLASKYVCVLGFTNSMLILFRFLSMAQWVITLVPMVPIVPTIGYQ